MIHANEEFSRWLIALKGFGVKSSKDVLSRINRINGFIDVDTSEDAEKMVYTLSLCPAFKAFSPSVRSQLRRAIKLYKEYQAR
jgi:DNA (cytosine-5)-methyltransferase 1